MNIEANNSSELIEQESEVSNNQATTNAEVSEKPKTKRGGRTKGSTNKSKVGNQAVGKGRGKKTVETPEKTRKSPKEKAEERLNKLRLQRQALKLKIGELEEKAEKFLAEIGEKRKALKSEAKKSKDEIKALEKQLKKAEKVDKTEKVEAPVEKVEKKKKKSKDND